MRQHKRGDVSKSGKLAGAFRKTGAVQPLKVDVLCNRGEVGKAVKNTHDMKAARIVERLLTPRELDFVAGGSGSADYIEMIIRDWPPVNYHQQISPSEDGI